jgi:hypothetical protein
METPHSDTRKGLRRYFTMSSPRCEFTSNINEPTNTPHRLQLSGPTSIALPLKPVPTM